MNLLARIVAVLLMPGLASGSSLTSPWIPISFPLEQEQVTDFYYAALSPMARAFTGARYEFAPNLAVLLAAAAPHIFQAHPFMQDLAGVIPFSIAAHLFPRLPWTVNGHQPELSLAEEILLLHYREAHHTQGSLVLLRLTHLEERNLKQLYFVGEYTNHWQLLDAQLLQTIGTHGLYALFIPASIAPPGIHEIFKFALTYSGKQNPEFKAGDYYAYANDAYGNNAADVTASDPYFNLSEAIKTLDTLITPTAFTLALSLMDRHLDGDPWFDLLASGPVLHFSVEKVRALYGNQGVRLIIQTVAAFAPAYWLAISKWDPEFSEKIEAMRTQSEPESLKQIAFFSFLDAYSLRNGKWLGNVGNSLWQIFTYRMEGLPYRWVAKGVWSFSFKAAGLTLTMDLNQQATLTSTPYRPLALVSAA